MEAQGTATVVTVSEATVATRASGAIVSTATVAIKNRCSVHAVMPMAGTTAMVVVAAINARCSARAVVTTAGVGVPTDLAVHTDRYLGREEIGTVPWTPAWPMAARQIRIVDHNGHRKT